MASNYALSYRTSRAVWWQKRHAGRRLRRMPVRAAIAVGVALLTALLFAQIAYGGSTAGIRHVTVHSGDTLWSIAASAYPDDSDIRGRIAEISDVNHLAGGLIEPGEQLTLPN